MQISAGLASTAQTTTPPVLQSTAATATAEAAAEEDEEDEKESEGECSPTLEPPTMASTIPTLSTEALEIFIPTPYNNISARGADRFIAQCRIYGSKKQKSPTPTIKVVKHCRS